MPGCSTVWQIYIQYTVHRQMIDFCTYYFFQLIVALVNRHHNGLKSVVKIVSVNRNRYSNHYPDEDFKKYSITENPQKKHKGLRKQIFYRIYFYPLCKWLIFVLFFQIWKNTLRCHRIHNRYLGEVKWKCGVIPQRAGLPRPYLGCKMIGP